MYKFYVTSFIFSDVFLRSLVALVHFLGFIELIHVKNNFAKQLLVSLPNYKLHQNLQVVLEMKHASRQRDKHSFLIIYLLCSLFAKNRKCV
jgi:hypothetical protein